MSSVKTKDYVIRLNNIDKERKLTAPSCRMHFAKQPMKISKAEKQYVYDDLGYEFLDCSGNIAHVGHCHPHVVHCGMKQMSTLASATGYVTEAQSKYALALLSTIPEGNFDTVLLVNSGSEASDLALRLAKGYTGRKDVIVPQPALHGHLSSLSSMHYKIIRSSNFVKDSWVHHVPICNTYRGRYSTSSHPAVDAVDDIKNLVSDLANKNTPVAAFLSETIHTAAGTVIPPKEYLPMAATAIRSAGGLVIIDEVLNGLGRTGTHFWSFQHLHFVPDIITCGRSMGNGQPLSAVITTHNIASCIHEYTNSYGGNPVSCAMGLAVFDVIKNEEMLESCTNVSKKLISGLKGLMDKHPNIGQVRGWGLQVAIELVDHKESKKPAPDIAEKMSYRLRDFYKILIPIHGSDDNCLAIIPPMCFSLENASTVVKAVDDALSDVEGRKVDDVKSVSELTEELKVPSDVLGSLILKRKDDSNDSEPSKKPRLEDID